MSSPTMKLVGSTDPEIKSGRATFTYSDDKQSMVLDLPDFAAAYALDRFIQSVYFGGKIAGAQQVSSAVQHTLKTLT